MDYLKVGQKFRAYDKIFTVLAIEAYCINKQWSFILKYRDESEGRVDFIDGKYLPASDALEEVKD